MAGFQLCQYQLAEIAAAVTDQCKSESNRNSVATIEYSLHVPLLVAITQRVVQDNVSQAAPEDWDEFEAQMTGLNLSM